MNQREFKESSHPAFLKAFLESQTGISVMDILREEARPKRKEDALQMASGADFVTQLALAHNYRLAQQEMIDTIKGLSEPAAKGLPKPKPEEGMDLEPEDHGDTTYKSTSQTS